MVLMEFEIFKQKVINALRQELGSDYRIYTNEVNKNNGVKLTGIMIEKKGGNTSPAIYINELYDQFVHGTELTKITASICKIYRDNCFEESVDLSGFTDFLKAKEKIVYKVVNYEKNKELLKELPYKKLENLALIFYYKVMEPPFFGNAAITITHAHRKSWEVETNELYNIAMQNTPVLLPAVIENMEDVMLKLFKKSAAKEVNGEEKNEKKECDRLLKEMEDKTACYTGKNKDRQAMYVLSNSERLQGAASMFYPGVLNKFSDQVKSDLLILPSSIHEVIVVPVENKKGNCKYLEIVKNVNENQVDEEEILADNIYYYSRKSLKIEMLL